MNQKITLTSIIAMMTVMPAVATPTNTSATFPADELMQADYTYTNQATYTNTGIYSDSVTANANYEWNLINVPAGQYLPANSATPQTCPAGSFCAGINNVHLDTENDQGATLCSTLDNGIYTDSATGATANTGCYRACDVSNMGTTIPTITYASTLSGNDYYGGTANDTCAVTACENGYHVDNNACTGNTITITWNGATAAAISANNAGTMIYGGDIRTPSEPDPSQIPAGKRFVGWMFEKLFNLSTLDASIDGTWDLDHTRWKPISNDGRSMANIFGTENSADLNNGEWADTFSYGTVKGEALCSSTNGKFQAETGNPDTSGSGSNCWCRATQYQASGSSTWQNVSSSSWVFHGVIGGASGCASGCAISCADDVQYDGAFRRPVYGITQ